MRAKVKVFTLASVALLSCRGILGIEDIEEGTADGGAGTPDAATDSAGTDSAALADAATESSATCAAQGSECGRCCRTSAGSAYKEELEPILQPCLCDAGCATQCGTSLCVGTDPKDTPCLPCMDQKIKENACPKERQDCAKKSAACKAVYDCLAGCP